MMLKFWRKRLPKRTWVLYNADALAGKPSEVWICEGEEDTRSALGAGKVAVGIENGEFLAEWAEMFRPAGGLIAAGQRSTVFLCLGDEAAERVACAFDRAFLPIPRRVQLPPGESLTTYLPRKGG